jgi:hypothetical protein
VITLESGIDVDVDVVGMEGLPEEEVVLVLDE